MKESTIFKLKAACYITAGFVAPFTAGLTQWFNTGEWPPPIVWVVIFALALGGGATQLLGFLSDAYSNYKKDRDAKPSVSQP